MPSKRPSDSPFKKTSQARRNRRWRMVRNPLRTSMRNQEEKTRETITEEKPKVVECTLNLDSVAMENTTQICAVFGVPEDKKMAVYKWVKAKKTNAVNELLNLYIDEMAGRM